VLNALVPVEGTLMEEEPRNMGNDPNGRHIRIIMPETQVRLSAGRMNTRRSAMCFLLVQILFLLETNY
jgi:biotin synthase-like enzyme